MEDKDPKTAGQNSLPSAKTLTPENSLVGEFVVQELLTLKKKQQECQGNDEAEETPEVFGMH